MNELLHKGSRTLETERLILRAFRPEDGAAMYRNWAGNPHVTRYLTWPVHESEAVSATLTAMWAGEAEMPDRYQWAIVLRSLGEPIGSIAVVSCNEAVRSAEIGYCIGETWWGQGITAEALRAVISYLTRDVGMNRIVACHDTENVRSGHVMEKAGMHFEGIARAGGRNNRGIVDMAVYAILADEVLAVNAALTETELP